MDRKKIADQLIIYCFWALVIVTALLIILPGNLLLLFLQLLFASALIGGIADWYGVTSIYGRPFNIKYKTEVIIQDRQKLVSEIRVFLTGDVLSKENIKEKLEGFHFTKRFFSFLLEPHNGVRPMEEILRTVSLIIYNTARDLDIEKISYEITDKIREIIGDYELKEELLISLSDGMNKDRIRVFVETGSRQLLNLRELEELRSYIYGKLEEFLKNYSADSKSRKILTLIFHGTIYEKFTEAIDREIIKLAKDPNHPLKEKWTEELTVKIQEEIHKEEFRNLLDEKIREALEKDDLRKATEEKLREILYREIPSPEAVYEKITPIAARELMKIQNSPEKLAGIENQIIFYLSKIIDENHDKIGDLLEENIDKMSDGELVSFIKDNTEGDLQMIRLNGMAFGMMISIVVFILKFALGLV